VRGEVREVAQLVDEAVVLEVKGERNALFSTCTRNYAIVHLIPKVYYSYFH